MLKLNQVIAIEKGVKSRVYGVITEINKVIQKPELFNGFAKTYQRKDEDSEDLPPERKRVQGNTQEALKYMSNSLSEILAVTAQKDWTNCVAKGSVIVNDKTLIADAPVSFLLFMEKQLTDVRTFIGNLPVLDEGESWTRDPNDGLFKTEATATHRTKKIAKPIVLYPATPEHPAQTQLIQEDIIVGFWNTTKQSGAMPKTDKNVLLNRVETLIDAIKKAREAANNFDVVESPSVGDTVFGFIFGE